jgi:hypothetical protein
MVLNKCLALNVPVAGYIGGGYDPDIGVLVARHTVLHSTAARLAAKYGL